MADDEVNAADIEVPPMQLAIRANDGTRVFEAGQNPDSGFGVDGGTAFAYSDDGMLYGVYDGTHVQVFRCDPETVAEGGWEPIASIEENKVRHIKFSPRGRFVVTWRMFKKNVTSEGNVGVFDLAADGSLAARFIDRSDARSTWGPQWTEDESLCVVAMKTVVNFYDGEELKENFLGALRAEGVTDFALSTGSAPYKVAIFTPGKKAAPATVRVYEFPNLEANQCTATKAFFRAENADLTWNPQGTALLCVTSTSVDTTGQSYYGETNVYYLKADGQFDCAVPLMEEGRVHSLSWHPSGRKFIVVHGNMPSKTVLYNHKCEAKFDFGTLHRNEVSFSPQGRFVAICGFGNLSGEMDFWDINKLKKIGSGMADIACFHQWAPSGRVFMTAVTAPRMQVDHGYKLWKYNGDLMEHVPIPGMMAVSFRPALAGVYPNLPASPDAFREGTSASGSGGAPAVAKPQKYIPPSLRNRQGGSRAKIQRDNSGPRRLGESKTVSRSGGGAGGGKQLTKSQIKNKKKREKKRREAQESRAKRELDRIRRGDDGTTASTDGSEGGSSVTSGRSGKSKGKAKSGPVLTDYERPEIDLTDASAVAKRLRNVNKKLRQIGNLKEQEGAGVILTEAQLNKVSHEDAFLDEKADLEAVAADLEG